MAETVPFSTVGWTDVGLGFKPEKQSREEVPQRFWNTAERLAQFVPQPPENLHDLTTTPVWSLVYTTFESGEQYWCFTVQAKGQNDRAGTTQFAFAPGGLPASVVWRAAVAASEESAQHDRLPWGYREVAIGDAAPPATLGTPAPYRDAAQALLTTLTEAPRLTVVGLDADALAAMIPGVLAVVPARIATERHWITCLLQTPKSAQAVRNTVVGQWSRPLRTQAGSAAEEVETWLKRVARPGTGTSLPAEDIALIGNIAAGLAAGRTVDPTLTATAPDLLTALDHVWTAWNEPAIDVPDLIRKKKWPILDQHLDVVAEWASSAPLDAADVVRSTRVESSVAGALLRGLWSHLPVRPDVADALGLPGPAGGRAHTTQLTWLGQEIQTGIGRPYIEQVIDALLPDGARWSTDAARLGCGPLFLAMGYLPHSRPDLFPFDTDGVASRIQQSQTVDATSAEQIAGSPDPLDAATQIAGRLHGASAELLGAVLGAALTSANRSDHWEYDLENLIARWSSEGGTASATRWARITRTALRGTRTAVPNLEDQATLVEAGIANLEHHRASASDILRAGSDLVDHLSARALRQRTAALAAQATQLWVAEVDGLNRELAEVRQTLDKTLAERDRYRSERDALRAAGGAPQAKTEPPSSRWSSSYDDKKAQASGDLRAPAPMPSDRPGSVLTAVKDLFLGREADGDVPPRRYDDGGAPVPRGLRISLIVMVAFAVLLLLGYLIYHAFSSGGSPDPTPTASTTTAVSPKPEPRLKADQSVPYNGQDATLVISNAGLAFPTVLASRGAGSTLEVIRGTVTSHPSGQYTAIVHFRKKLPKSEIHVWVVVDDQYQDIVDKVLSGQQPASALGEETAHFPSAN